MSEILIEFKVQEREVGERATEEKKEETYNTNI
jgi:hypothetical protein